MSATLWNAASSNGFSTTLDGSISGIDASITLTTTTGLQAPGVLVIDRQNSDSEDTPAVREYITYTGISLNTLTGCTRGIAGSSAQAHSSGAIVEETMSITHWNDLVEFLGVSHGSGGHILTSNATIADLTVGSRLNVSGISLIGQFPIHPTWVISANVSGATAGLGLPLPMPQTGRLTFVSAFAHSIVSGASLVIDFNKNGSTMFTNQATRLVIPGGSQFASTASIGDGVILSGERMTWDVDTGGFSIPGLTVMGRVA